MYGIIRAEKVKMTSVKSGLKQHNQREAINYKNKEIDFFKLDEDINLIQSSSFEKSIKNELQKHNITKTIRKDAVGLIDGVMTASPEFFKGQTKRNIVAFFKNALPLIEREYGAIISATIHFDEKTPHMHFDCVPIVQDPDGTFRLCAKEKMGNKADYIARQDRFHENYFSHFGLARGESAAQTGREHLSDIGYKEKQIKKSIISSREELQGINDDLQYAKKQEIKQFHINENLENKNRVLRAENTNLEAQNQGKKAMAAQLDKAITDKIERYNEITDERTDTLLALEEYAKSHYLEDKSIYEYFEEEQQGKDLQSIIQQFDDEPEL